jgi:transcriptional regulator with GAF, ATPase, and Fis domain
VVKKMAKKTTKKAERTARGKKVEKKTKNKNVNASVEGQLRRALLAVEIADSLTDPLSRSIKNLLQLAADSVNSAGASVLVRDGNEGGLRFMAASGAVGEKLVNLKVPPGEGIAGFVFSSGQPMVVADSEGRIWRGADQKTGFETKTVLATPLRVEDEIVGVLEFVNRTGDQASFSPADMDQAAHFADAIATLVDAHERASLVEKLFERLIGGLRGNSDGEIYSRKKLRRWLSEMRSAPEHRDLIQIAVALRDVAARGDAERELCREMLDALSRFTERTGSHTTGYFSYS